MHFVYIISDCEGRAVQQNTSNMQAVEFHKENTL